MPINKSETSNRIPALVMGVDVSALNIIRSLGRRGIDVYAMGSNPHDYGAVSRYVKFVPCENLTQEETVISGLLEISKYLGKKMVLFCTSDLHVLYVSKNRDILREAFDFVIPDHTVVEMLMDKRKFSDFANRHGFPVPKTFFSNNRADFQKIAKSIPYPIIVKPLYRTVYWSKNVPPDKKVIKANSPRDMIQKLEDLKAVDQPLILQEWIDGSDQGIYFCLAYIDRQGSPLALFTGKKLRQYPSLTGVTSIAESIKQQKVAEITLELFNKAGCKGLCSVEFKYDASVSSYKITEPTVGRVDLQEGISTQAGLDIPFIAYQDAFGISQPAQSDYMTGLKWINEPFELNAFLARDTGNGYGIGAFFHPYRGHRSFALMALDDPKPFFHFLIWAGKRGLRYLKKVSPILKAQTDH